MEVEPNKMIVGKKYIRVRRDNGKKIPGANSFIRLSDEGFPTFDAGNGYTSSSNPIVFKFYEFGIVSPTAVNKIAEDKNLPEDVGKLIKKFGGTKKNRRRHTKKKTSHRRRR